MTKRPDPLPQLKRTYREIKKKAIPHSLPDQERRTHRLATLISPSQFDQMKAYAYRQGYSVGRLVELATAEYMNTHPLKPGTLGGNADND